MRKIIYISIFLVGFNFFYSNNLISKNCIFRRIRGTGDNKEEIVINHFIQRLTNKVGDKILAVYIIPKELREKKEEIDLIVIFDRVRMDLLRIATDIKFQTSEKHDKSIFFAPLSKEGVYEEFNRYFYTLPLWRIFQAGSCLYFGPKGKKSLIEVSEEFINSAEEKLEEADFYHSSQALYRAVLILLNAVVGGEKIYSSERPDIFEQFRKNFILTGKVPATWSEKIDRLRELNEELDQNPDIAIDKKELTSLLDFLKELYLYVKD